MHRQRFDQNLQRYLTFYDKQINKPLRVNVVKPAVPEEEEKAQGEQIEEKPDKIETDILDNVPATMKSRTRQLIKKLKANKDIIGWNEQGQMVFKGTTIPGTNIVDLVNDSLCQRKNFNPEGWELFSKVLGRLNVPEGIVQNENRLEGVPKPTTPLTRVKAAKKKKRRDVMSSPYKWLKLFISCNKIVYNKCIFKLILCVLILFVPFCL